MQDSTWNEKLVSELFKMPFFELISQAYKRLTENFDPREMEFCTLLSVKTGTCPEDCAYCPQSGHYKTGLDKQNLLDVQSVIAKAKEAKQAGSKRLCIGAAWKNPPTNQFPKILDMVRHIKAEGLEACATLGMLSLEQAEQLKAAGLDFYNHNLDTSPDFYSSIITTRTYQDRLDTIKHVVKSGLQVCCGGILGMGETIQDRIKLLLELSKLPNPPKSIPINKLIRIPGTPLEKQPEIDSFDFIKTIAVARIMFPTSRIRLSAGRSDMSEETQAWCFMAGANSIWLGDKLLTAKNSDKNKDLVLLEKLGIQPPEQIHEEPACATG